MYEDRLRELGLLSLERRRSGRPYNILPVLTRKLERNFFTRVCSDRTKRVALN